MGSPAADAFDLAVQYFSQSQALFSWLLVASCYQGNTPASPSLCQGSRATERRRACESCGWRAEPVTGTSFEAALVLQPCPPCSLPPGADVVLLPASGTRVLTPIFRPGAALRLGSHCGG